MPTLHGVQTAEERAQAAEAAVPALQAEMEHHIAQRPLEQQHTATVKAIVREFDGTLDHTVERITRDVPGPVIERPRQSCTVAKAEYSAASGIVTLPGQE